MKSEELSPRLLRCFQVDNVFTAIKMYCAGILQKKFPLDLLQITALARAKKIHIAIVHKSGMWGTAKKSENDSNLDYFKKHDIIMYYAGTLHYILCEKIRRLRPAHSSHRAEEVAKKKPSFEEVCQSLQEKEVRIVLERCDTQTPDSTQAPRRSSRLKGKKQVRFSSVVQQFDDDLHDEEQHQSSEDEAEMDSEDQSEKESEIGEEDTEEESEKSAENEDEDEVEVIRIKKVPAEKKKLFQDLLDNARLSRRGYKCPKCSAVRKWKAWLKNHLCSHFEKMFACGQCGQTFNHESNMRAHYRTEHTEVPLLKCRRAQCDYTSYNIRLFNQHKRYHKSKRRCPNCTYVTPCKSNLNRHIKKMH